MVLLKYARGIVIIFIVAVGLAWGITGLIENKKIITENGFFIKSAPLPFVTVEYVFDRKQKIEKIHQNAQFFERSFAILYSGDCDCVLSFGDFDKDESVSELTPGEYLFRNPIAEKVLPRGHEKVKGMLQEGKQLRDEMRKRYAGYFKNF